ncbi:hypothetical protein [Burkholderia sp. Ac-20365]|uniref:hypothetical protein n=1 Tax=Burkholderia sp. Ac-20365 TaxID=2703897 RepID=UPI00197B2031|nr:hypothetical protein [Burkholderia sp. Ac-20365]MBN3762227.1 hypothetical protein [Burkholderia sp. Ac-20365]
MGNGLWASRPKPPSGTTGPAPDARLPSPSSLSLRIAGPRGWKAVIALTLVAIVALAVIVMFLHLRDDSADVEQQRASNMVQGSVTTDGAGQSTQSPASTSNDRTATTQNNAVASMAAPESVPSPETTEQSAQSASSPSVRGTDSSAEPAGSTKSGTTKNQRLIALALARARAGLEKNDLRMARSGVFWALSLQRDNSEALMLKQELLARERGRNSPSDARSGSGKGADSDY